MKNGMESNVTMRSVLCAGALALLGAHAFAQNPNASHATRIYNRIAGVPPSATVSVRRLCTRPPATTSVASPAKGGAMWIRAVAPGA